MTRFFPAASTTHTPSGFFDNQQSEEIKKMQSLMRKEKLGTLSSQWLAILIRKYPLAYEAMLLNNGRP